MHVFRLNPYLYHASVTYDVGALPPSALAQPSTHRITSCVFCVRAWPLLPPGHTHVDARIQNSTRVVWSNSFIIVIPWHSTIHLSVVPAYNEEARISPMLDETLGFLEARKFRDASKTYEVIVVDDGSRDGTVGVVRRFCNKHDSVRLLELHKNHGKGGAVRKGALRARGRRILMVDADAATKFSDLEALEAKLDSCTDANGFGVVVGSRGVEAEVGVVAPRMFALRVFARCCVFYFYFFSPHRFTLQPQRNCLRKVQQELFHVLVSLLCVSGIRDTQCGFKLFTRNSACALFRSMHIERWAFDVELLHIAMRMDMPVREVRVRWQEVDGSKITLLTPLTMLKDMLIICLFYKLRIWKVAPARDFVKATRHS